MKRRRGLRWEWEPAGWSQGETGQRAVAREVRSGASRLHKRDDQRRDSRKPITRRSWRMSSFMPLDSSWKTAVVRVDCSRA